MLFSFSFSLEKLLAKPYGPFALDEIKRKAEKDYFEMCAAVQTSGGPNEDFMMPQQYEHAIKFIDASESTVESLDSPKKLKR